MHNYFIVYSIDKSFRATESTQKVFLSWQSTFLLCAHVMIFKAQCFFVFSIAWDNLRIDVYGFVGFTEYFFSRHPGYFLSPLRISGSAVETLFGQYKYMSGNKLDAVNYSTCRSKYLAKQAVHYSGQFYRDENLSMPMAPLEKKKYQTVKK